ncbi:aromatic ring-hydroxylating dioxygenase subunit alpha [Sphingomonas sp. 67-41]|jgi:phenylpropionate dioxygenase-like ring-hydroxylating dioxygenase large terminal subunit|uniref:aromatic ring-hydroxylating oxygenase subunit alpha n=1 Tax=Sphingomonas TaxID=13687 RepID=UPI00257A7B52|nr:aromatic ring-hydroxylating dioxygenase subunit alpha [Sphingomonas sp. 67-41]
MRDLENKAMIHDTARELLRLIDARTTHQERDLIAVDPDCYLDETLFETEKRTLFRETPLLMAFTADMPNPGDWRVHDDTGVPVLVVRGRDGIAKAFLNACRHRGARLTEGLCGSQKRFTCPYHAWTYDTAGKLIGLPSETLFGEVDRATLGLIELPLAEQYGMIWVRPTPGDPIDPAAIMGPGTGGFEGWHLEGNTLIGERDIVTDANWKLALDTYFENYHFHVLHAEAFGPFKVPNVAHHWRWGEKNRNFSIAWPSKSITALSDTPEAEWGDVHEHFSIQNFFFPNTAIAIYPDTCSVFQIYPGEKLGEQRTRMRFYSRNPEPTAEQTAVIQGRFETFYHVLQNEDYTMVGQAFKAISSGLMPAMLFGRNEPALNWLHESLEEATFGNRPTMMSTFGLGGRCRRIGERNDAGDRTFADGGTRRRIARTHRSGAGDRYVQPDASAPGGGARSGGDAGDG